MANFTLRKLIVQPVGGEPFLIVEVEIQTALGSIDLTIPGVCIATLTKHLGAIQQQHPELCGTEATQVGQTTFSGRVDPSKAEMN